MIAVLARHVVLMLQTPNDEIRRTMNLGRDAYAKMLDRYKRDTDRSMLSSVLYCEIIRRRYDGLIIVRPVNWFVYYERGESFYYVSSSATSKSGIRCTDTETPCLILTPIDESSLQNSNKRMRFGCLNVPFVTLASLFAQFKRSKISNRDYDEVNLYDRVDDTDCDCDGYAVIPLDSLLETSGKHVTVVTIVNYLISKGNIL